jgi:16S rRNA (cytosine967-C5)-methyltransferase
LSADPRRKTGAEARAVAAKLVTRVVRDGVSLETALDGAPRLESRDAALVRALASGALRWHHRLRWQARRLLRRPLAGRDAELAALISVGLLQLQSLRTPDHAAVSATVAAAGLLGAGRAKRGLVNAVLRRYQRERDSLEAAIEDVPEALYSHPRWLIERLRSEWPADWRKVLEANNEGPPMWLRVNLRRMSRADYVESLRVAGIAARPSAVAPAAVLLEEPRSTRRLPGYAEGLVSVQDAAAQLAAGFLALAPGQRVLDACAAPGGKTAHILESNVDLRALWALDRDVRRLETTRALLDRLGLRATLRHADAARPEQWWDGRAFDRILLDAPCTGCGVIRRHPDIKLLRRAADVARAASEQARLLKALWPLLAPGGRLLYATCSVLREENHDQTRRFLSSTADARLGGPAPAGDYQRLPGEANADGFYYACLDKLDRTNARARRVATGISPRHFPPG